jgi:hypothetical protein
MTPEQIAALPPNDRPIARLIAKRGMSAVFNGHAWRVTGPGVEIHTVRLCHLVENDLRPPLVNQRW